MSQTNSLNSLLKNKEKYIHYLYDVVVAKIAQDLWIAERDIFNY